MRKARLVQISALAATTAAAIGLTQPAWAANSDAPYQYGDPQIAQFTQQPEWPMPLSGQLTPPAHFLDIKYDDGKNHANEYPEELRNWWTNQGKDIMVTLKSGKIMNASYTYYTAWKQYHHLLATLPAGVQRQVEEAYGGIYPKTRQLNAGYNFNRWDFVESAQDGKVRILDSRFYTFRPGDTIHIVQNWQIIFHDDKLPRKESHISKSEIAPKAYYCRSSNAAADNPSGYKWVTECPIQYYMPLYNVTLNEKPVPGYSNANPAEQFVDRPNEYHSVVSRYIEIANRSKDPNEVYQTLKFSFDVPEKGPLFRLYVPTDMFTDGWAGAAPGLAYHVNYYREPQAQIQDVDYRAYRKAMEYTPEQTEIIPRLRQKYGMSYAQAYYDRTNLYPSKPGEPDPTPGPEYSAGGATKLKETLYSPLAIKPLPNSQNDRLKGLSSWNFYYLDSDADYLKRDFDRSQPYYQLLMPQERWQEIKNHQIPGYVLVGDDIFDFAKDQPVARADKKYPPETRLSFRFITNPDEPELMLTQYYYRVYRPVPGALQINKADAMDETRKLAGAQFEIWSPDHKRKLTEQIFTTNNSGQIDFYTGNLQALTSTAISALPEPAQTASVTNADGSEYGLIKTADGILFEPGKYSLKEVAAPQDYQLPENPWVDFEVQQQKEVPAVMPINFKNQKIIRPPKFELPKTGGSGYWVWLIGGSTLLVGAGGILLRRYA